MKTLFHGDVYLRKNGTIGWHPLGDGMEMATLPLEDAQKLSTAIKAKYAAITEEQIDEIVELQYERFERAKVLLDRCVIAHQQMYDLGHGIGRTDFENFDFDTYYKTSHYDGLKAYIFEGKPDLATIASDAGFNPDLARVSEEVINRFIKDSTHPDHPEYVKRRRELVEREVAHNFAPLSDRDSKAIYQPLVEVLLGDNEWAAKAALKGAITFGISQLREDPVRVIEASARALAKESFGESGTPAQISERVKKLESDIQDSEAKTRAPLNDAMDAIGLVCIAGPENLMEVSLRTMAERVRDFVHKGRGSAEAQTAETRFSGLSSNNVPIITVSDESGDVHITLTEEKSHALDDHFPFSEGVRRAMNAIPNQVMMGLEKWSGKRIDEYYRVMRSGTEDDIDNLMIGVSRKLAKEMSADIPTKEVVLHMIVGMLNKLGVYEMQDLAPELFAVVSQHHFSKEPFLEGQATNHFRPSVMQDGISGFSPEIAETMREVEKAMLRKGVEKKVEEGAEGKPYNNREAGTQALDRAYGKLHENLMAIEQMRVQQVGLPGRK